MNAAGGGAATLWLMIQLSIKPQGTKQTTDSVAKIKNSVQETVPSWLKVIKPKMLQQWGLPPPPPPRNKTDGETSKQPHCTFAAQHSFANSYCAKWTQERESSYSYLVTIPALTCLQERKG
jgi:hypothetical protein